MCCLLVLKFGFEKLLPFFEVKIMIEGTISSITKTVVQLLNFSSKHFNYKIQLPNLIVSIQIAKRRN